MQLVAHPSPPPPPLSLKKIGQPLSLISLKTTNTQGKLERMVMQNLGRWGEGGVNKVHSGLYEIGEF